ncbi:hypothetical protein ACFL10_00230 [Patescibacteria group bacterium]
MVDEELSKLLTQYDKLAARFPPEELESGILPSELSRINTNISQRVGELLAEGLQEESLSAFIRVRDDLVESFDVVDKGRERFNKCVATIMIAFLGALYVKDEDLLRRQLVVSLRELFEDS